MDLVTMRGHIYLVCLDPTRGGEIRKTRPCLVVSPDEMNDHLTTVVVAPMTTTIRDYPTRIPCRFQGKKGQVALDQIRSVDKTRLVKSLGPMPVAVMTRASKVLVEMFS